MPEVRVTQELSSPAEVVWALIGDFGALHRWHPAVRGLDLSWEGRIRTLHFADGTRAVERLETRNDAARRYVYAWVDGPLPMRGCRATLQVTAHHRGCTVTWSCVFEPAEAHEHAVHQALRHHYAEGLTALALALAG
ncbi:SRPBCC family protein [Dyella sedimenti]|uniref:SRPBCC family protein n=1 Tax=Dyella sedimenti TaxID=2919947 RepID=UPI001FAA3D69|nr:SRPBCC family protein [Dyella sedimenti]